MPSFDEGAAPAQVIVSFRDAADRDAFMALIGCSVVQQKVGPKWSLWWPEKELEDRASVRLETGA
jgi:hypothetical protein